MRPTRLAVLVAVLFLAVSIPAAALAGGWSVVTLDTLPTGVVQGQEVTVGFTVLQHGKTPLAKLGPKLKFTHATGNQQIAVDATDDGAPGHYVARFTLPESGTWNWVIHAFEGDHPMPAIEVKAAPVNTASGPLARVPIGSSWPLAAAVGALLVAAGALVVVFSWRWGVRAARQG